MRYEEMNPCKECRKYGAHCSDSTTCLPIRTKLRSYGGVRFTSDGFDCALPVAIDSHSVCSFGCLYCFSDNLVTHRETRKLDIGQTSLKKLERIFSGAPSKEHDIIRCALKYDNRNANGYPCPVQLGAICDALDNIERNQGWFLEYTKLVDKYRQPTRISTKGNLFLTDDYLDAVSRNPELWWVAFSIISCDDDVLSKVDLRAPNATERLASMKRLSSRGISTSLRFRPIFPGISDATKKYPDAYKVLINRAAEAGAKAVSYEVGFVPGNMPGDIRSKWENLEEISGLPLKQIYRNFGRQACTRPSYMWTEQIMHSIHEEAHKCGLTVGVSDPAWKQLTDVGCCCGIKPDDPVFGNWERENATNALMNARDTGQYMYLKDIVPPWAYLNSISGICAYQATAGPLNVYNRRHTTWADFLKETWNELKKERSPLNYFQGAIVPIDRDEDGNVVYQYKGLKRTNKHSPYWMVNKEGNKENGARELIKEPEAMRAG